MPAMKRRANSPMKSSKKAKPDSVKPKIQELASLLSNSECDVPPPNANRDMLVAAVPFALSDFKEDRHGYQNTVATLIGEVVQGWVAKWEQLTADAKTHVATTDTDLASANESKEAAKSNLNASKEEVKVCKEALKAASDVEKETATALKAAKDDCAAFEQEMQKVISEKDNISRLFNQSFLILKNNEDLSTSEEKAHMKHVQHALKQLSLEPSLTVAFAPAVSKKVSARGVFDKMAVDEIESGFTRKIQALEAEIANQDSTKAAKDAKAGEATAAHDAAASKKQECQAALKASQESQQEKEKSADAAEKNVDAMSKAVNKAKQDESKQQRGLDHAKADLGTFKFLSERTTPPPAPEPEEAPEAEETPAEAAGAPEASA